MAETITLQAYLNELSNMLERGVSSEVVSHCRYILQHFPQNVETYRLLAQALLQRGHHEGVTAFFDEAAEVFQRVLSVTPNDYVAHLGLSEIREQEGDLDRAIWHMERAYEQIPGNQVLQDALRTLYVKRDGEANAPTKIQLTQGALARQYVNGQLYDQALIELRNALHKDPDRVDLEVMLAETLWESQHPVEAGEAAVRILKRLPNCLAANRILAHLWLENERPTDAQRFLDRLEAVDPYQAAAVLQPDTEVYDTTSLNRLDYNAQAQAALSQETPDWVQELGDIDMGNVFSLDEALPPSDAGFEAPAPERVQFDADWMVADDAAPAEVSSPETAVPDWFADLEQDTGADVPELTADAAAWEADLPVGDDQPQSEPEDISPGEVPDWFAESMGEAPEMGAVDAAEQAPVEANWLADGEGVPSFGEPETSPEDLSALFDDLEAEADTATDEFAALFAEPEAAAGETDEPEELEEAEEADWLGGSAAADEFAAIDELEAVTSPGQPGTSDAPEAGEDAKIPQSHDEILGDFPLADFGEDDQARLVSAEEEDAEYPSSGFTDILAGVESARAASQAADQGDEEEDLMPPEWLATFEADDSAETTGVDAAESERAMPEELESDWLTEPDLDFFAPAPEPVIDLPDHAGEEDWMQGVEESAEVDQAEAWLMELDEADESGLVEVPQSTSDEAQEETAAELVSDDAADWLVAAEHDEDEAADSAQVDVEERIVEDEQHEPSDAALSAASEAGDLFEVGDEVDQGTALDWLQQPQEAGDDWLGPLEVEDEPIDELAGAETDDERAEVAEEPIEVAEPAEPVMPASEVDLSDESQVETFDARESPEPAEIDESAEEWAVKTGEWLAAMPDLELESVPDEQEDEAVAFDAVEDELFTADMVEVEEVSADAETGELDWAEDEDIAEMPVSEMEMSPVSDRSSESETADSFDEPYDPFEGGSPDQVPEYESATETGVLQPDESPDWMRALTGELSPEQVEVYKADTEAEGEEGERESLLAALGFETSESSEDEEAPVSDSSADLESDEIGEVEEELEEPEEVPLDLDQLAPPAEEDGAMPDWLVAITGASQPPDELGLDEAEAPAGVAEDADLLALESEFDWLAPMSESPEQAELTPDEDKVLAALSDIEETLGAGEPDESAFADLADRAAEAEAEEAQAEQDAEIEFEFEGLTAEAEVADAELPDDDALDEMFAEFEMEEVAVDHVADDAGAAVSETSEPEVAHPSDLAHTKDEVRDTAPAEAFEFDTAPSSIGGFSFEDLTPRWLRKPKDSSDSASIPAEQAPDVIDTPDWLRDAFEGDEAD